MSLEGEGFGVGGVTGSGAADQLPDGDEGTIATPIDLCMDNSRQKKPWRQRKRDCMIATILPIVSLWNNKRGIEKRGDG